MAQILVKTPVTSNGRDPIMNPDGTIRYKETILESGAQKVLEKINNKLPTHLKKIITPFEAKKVVKEEKSTGLTEAPQEKLAPVTETKTTKQRGKKSNA